MNEINYYEVLGVPEPTDTSANIEEVADPQEVDTETTEDLGEEAQEVADPDETDTDETDTDDSTVDKPDGPTQTAEDNKRYAAARRKAEAEKVQAVAEARAEAQKMVDDTVASAGLINRFTGKPITTKAELDSYRESEVAEKRRQLLNDAGMSEQDFGQFLGNLPEVKRAKEAQARAEEIQRAATVREGKAKLDEAVREISKIDPDITSAEDIVKSDTDGKISEMIKRGYSLVDAYRLVNNDKITARAVEMAKRTTAKQVQGKTHLQQSKSRGASDKVVPADIKAEYKRLMPNITDAEITAHYNRKKK